MNEPLEELTHLHEYQECAGSEFLERLGFDNFHEFLFHYLSFDSDDAKTIFVSECNDAGISILFDKPQKEEE